MSRATVGKVLALLACMAGAAALQASMPTLAAAERGRLFVPRPEVARAASLGFRALLADYYWMRAVQIVGAEDRPQDHGAVLGQVIDVVTTLDPWVDHPYRFAAVWLTESAERVREANRLLRRGLAHHPEDWRNPFHLGFNHFYYLGENAEAADALEHAASLPGAPLYLGRLAARLRADVEDLETAAVFLRMLAEQSADPFARAEYEKALDEIETERRARTLDDALARFRARAGRDPERLEELARGPHAVLRRLPPEPHGFEWVIDEKTGRVLSSWYGHRYEPHRIDGSRPLTDAPRGRTRTGKEAG